MGFYNWHGHYDAKHFFVMKPTRTHTHFKIASRDDWVHATLHVEACVDPPLDAFALLVTPRCALLRRRTGTSVLDELFRHTVAYELPCQGLGCMWVAEDEWGVDAIYLFGRARCGGLEPAWMRGALPVLIYRA